MVAETQKDNQMLKIILAEQKRRGLSDEEWVNFLGISWGGWSRFKNGQRRITNNFLVTVATKCPEIQLAIYQYMNIKGGD